MHRFQRSVAYAALLAAALALAACARTPYTNRPQLILVSEAESAQMGAQAYQQVLSKSDVVRGGPQVDQVVRVGRRIAVASGLRADWRFAVIDDAEQQNAFALPGGKVAVYTGLLPVTQSDAGLAVVLGHEVAHVVARHGAERVGQAVAAQAGGAALGVALGGGAGAQAVMAAYGLGAEYGVLRPFSREQESEADEIGLILMAKAGYDPHEAITFWQRMERTPSSRGGPPAFLSTHPSHGARIEKIRETLPRALAYYQGAGAQP